MAGLPCPVCQTPAAPAGNKRGDRTGQIFALSRCPACGFGFVDDPLTDLAAVYDEAYYAGRGADPLVDYAFEYAHPDRTVRRYEWRGWDRMIRRLGPQPGTAAWLDFGCGCGTLVRDLRRRGWEHAVGFDTGAWAEKARAGGVPILLEEELAARQGSFDVVTAIDVIEHVADPLEFLRRLRRLLKPGGLLIALTQNADIAPRDFAAWSYVRPEIHVSFFTARALAEALRATGFEPFVPERLPGWTDLMRSRILKNLRVKRTNPLEACLPWGLLGRLADAKTRMRAMPLGAVRKLPFSLWGPLGLMFAAEFWIFDQFGAHRHTWIYARWNDQVQYLTEAYSGWELVRLHGFFAGLGQAVIRPCVQGALHPVLAILAFAVAGGPSRSAALALNMLAMILWQGAAAFVTWRRTGSRALAGMVAALPLALAWPWNNSAGSAIDFRLDHLALCAMGTTLAACFASDGFRSRSGSAAFGVAAGFTVLTRFITAVYLTPIFAVLLLGLLGGPERGRRLRCALGTAALAAAIAVPFLWLDRTYIWSYYGIGHSTGPEAAVRDPHMDFWASAVWLVRGVGRAHLGPILGWIVLGTTAALGGGALWRRRRTPEPLARPAQSPRAARQLAAIGLLFAVVPALVLAQHKLKSDIVVGISAPGILAVMLAVWIVLAEASPAAWRGLCAGAVVLACAGFFAARQFEPAYSSDFVVDARKVTALAETIFRRSREAGLKEPRVGVDYITDSIDAQAMRLLCYEHHRVMVPFVMTLPTGIVAEPEDLLLERMRQSDFFLLTEAGPPGVWPFDVEMRALYPQARAWCDSHFRLVDRFPLFGRRMVLYQRKEIPLD